jgi:hypothetical protein
MLRSDPLSIGNHFRTAGARDDRRRASWGPSAPSTTIGSAREESLGIVDLWNDRAVSKGDQKKLRHKRNTQKNVPPTN